MEQLFFEILRVAIGAQDKLSRVPSEKEWGDVYKMAKKQSLVGICFSGVHRLSEQSCEVSDVHVALGELNKTLYLNWLGVAAKIQQRNDIMNRQCVELQKRLREDGIDSYVLKGQGVAAAYHNLALLRQPGDIDLFVDCGMDRALEYMRKVAPTNEINHKHVQLHVFNDTEVELHYIPAELHCPWQNRHLQAFFTKWNGKKVVQVADEQEIVVPCDEFQVVHLLVHAYRHLFGDGIGLRQVMDLYFVMKSLPTDFDYDAIKKVVHASGMTQFASAMMWVLNYVFGFEVMEMLWQPNPRDGQFLLSEIMKTGNFGHYDERFDKKGETRRKRFWRVTKGNWRLKRFSIWEAICTPLWRIWHFCWMRFHGYTQG